ncbi:MAG: hypothetical protein M0P31_03045 [Solirubrobacteraceae bacterium]|nr:hypothetical protein [Solirubrobacteraceae bacterium]
MGPGHRRALLAVGAVAVVLAGLLVGGDGFLLAVPALFLFTCLLSGRYVGEAAVLRLRRRRARPTATAASTGTTRPATVAVRGGRLIAASLAGRAPPRPIAAA